MRVVSGVNLGASSAVDKNVGAGFSLRVGALPADGLDVAPPLPHRGRGGCLTFKLL